MALNYSKLPTVDQAFALLTPVSLAGDSSGSMYLASRKLSNDMQSNDGVISVMSSGNLLIARLVDQSQNRLRVSVDCVGSIDLGTLLTLEREGDLAIVTTSMGSRRARDTRLQADSKKEGEEVDFGNVTEFKHTFDVSLGIPKILNTEVIRRARDDYGPIAPVFENLYRYTSILEYFYATSSAISTEEPASNSSDETSVKAFWSSWADFGKAALVATAGIAGGAIGAIGSGATTLGLGSVAGAAGGFSTGASIAETVWDWFT